MSYQRGGYPPEYQPQPVVVPLTAERFMELLDAYVVAGTDDDVKVARADLARAVGELFGRLAQ